MSRPASLFLNTASNLTSYAISVVVAFFLSPFLIHTLGNARYGAWTLIGTISGYYGFLDVGIRGAVTVFVARSLARADIDGFRRVTSTAFWILLGVGLVVVGSSLTLSILHPDLFRAEGVDPRDLRLGMLVMSITIGLILPMDVFSGVLSGARRLDLANGIDIVTRLSTAGASYLVVRAGGGLADLGMVQLAGRIVGYGLIALAAVRLVSDVSLHPRWVSRRTLKELVDFGGRSTVVNMGRLLSDRSDAPIIAANLGVASVTYYNLGRLIVDYCGAAVSAFAFAFTPHFAHLYSAENRSMVIRQFLSASRLGALLSFNLAGYALVFGHAFLALWVGPSFVSGSVLSRSDVVLAVLIIGYTPRFLQAISWQLIYAASRLDRLPAWMLAEGALLVGLTLLLVRPYGLLGVALASALSTLLVSGLWVARHTLTTFEIPLRRYLLHAIGPAALTAAMSAMVGAVMIRFHPPASWWVFLTEAAVTLATSIALAVTIGLDRDHRTALRHRMRGSSDLP